MTTKTIELWKPVYLLPGMEDFHPSYLVSNQGRLRTKLGKISKGKPNNYGYVRPTLLTKGGKVKRIYLHRLVGLAFVEGFEEGLVVNHLDEVKTNNHYSNLEWTTPAENANHGTRNKRISKANSRPVEAITDGVIFGFKSTRHAAEFGFSNGHVSTACRGVLNKQNSHGGTNFYNGYEWRYANA